MNVLKFVLSNSKPYKFYLLGMFLAICIITVDDTIKPILVKNLIDTVSGNADYNLWNLCIIYGTLHIIMVASWIFNDYCVVSYMPKFRIEIAKFFMNHLYNRSYAFFQNQLVGNLVAKIEDTLQIVPDLIFTFVSQFFYFTLLISASTVILAKARPIFAIITIAWIIVFFSVTCLFMKNLLLLTKNYAEEKSKILGLTSDYLSNIFSVKLFSAKNFEVSRFCKLGEFFLSIARRQGFYLMKFYGLQGFLTSIYVIGLVVYLILEHKNSRINPGDFALVIMTNFNIISAVYQLSYHMRAFISDFGIVGQALSIIENAKDIQDKPDAKTLQVSKGEIVFDSVTFQYKEAEPVFQNLSITIEAGQKVGLVGYSGSGKSTFVNLLLRLYDVIGGGILIDGQNIIDVTQDSLRDNIAIVPQETPLFHRTIMENIRYGKINATDEEVIEAARKAYCHDFIMKLKEKYDYLVGERGLKISGGQRQRIAIARAILKNSPILVLDEATSQLDSIIESEIQESLWNLMQGKTTLVVAHRLSTLLHMDRILVFDKGKIIEDGDHFELINKDGLYKTLWDAQRGGFLPNKKVMTHYK